MYQIKKTRDQFEHYILEDKSNNVKVEITPARGGMLTGLSKSGKEYLYVDRENIAADERPRCAMPILFPICGMVQDNILRIEGKEFPIGIHGIAHLSRWEVVSHDTRDGATITLQMGADEVTKKSYPFDFRLRFTYTLKDGCISVEQEYHNEDQRIMPFTYGFHPYFRVSDVKNLKFNINAKHILTADGQKRKFDGQLALPEGKETMAAFDGADEYAEFIDTSDGKKVRVEFDGSFPNVVLWSITEKNFICVEPWSAMPNALNMGSGRELQPGETWSAKISIRI